MKPERMSCESQPNPQTAGHPTAWPLAEVGARVGHGQAAASGRRNPAILSPFAAAVEADRGTRRPGITRLCQRVIQTLIHSGANQQIGCVIEPTGGQKEKRKKSAMISPSETPLEPPKARNGQPMRSSADGLLCGIKDFSDFANAKSLGCPIGVCRGYGQGLHQS